jgi:hypothetical protein
MQKGSAVQIKADREFLRERWSAIDPDGSLEEEARELTAILAGGAQDVARAYWRHYAQIAGLVAKLRPDQHERAIERGIEYTRSFYGALHDAEWVGQARNMLRSSSAAGVPPAMLAGRGDEQHRRACVQRHGAAGAVDPHVHPDKRA